ncbi:MAG TPA: ATP-binding cassette domain-containing protein, partial [Planctomycetota bacterium]|nr:ATP-binding cassette domain-containing protein [Planctomycetota bacterium]
MSIVLDRIVKRYDGSNVVDECSLEIADGELFVLLGASGSGKSTILRLIAGLLPLDGGQVLLHGRRVDELPPQKRDVGFVFQNYSLFRHMTVAENIEFGLKIRGRPRRDRQRRRDELLEVVGLAGLGERYPSQLSGGQMQRVALARALAYEPAVLLLDEPFGALDVKIRAQLRQSLKAIQRALRVTTILVTHDQDEAFELGDRIGVMERGRLLEIGRPEELYRAPRTEYVATFLGAGNVIAGRVEAGRIRLGSVSLALPPHAADTASGSTVSVLCRPEELLMSLEAGALTGTLLGRARIVERVFAGPAERLFLRCEDLRGAHAIVPAPAYGEDSPILQAIARPDPPGAAGRPLAVGDEVFVSLRSYHVFKHPGMRLLVCTDGTENSIAYGLTLARALDGPATLLAVGEDAHERRLLRNWLEEVTRLETRHESSISIATRLGKPADEILAELEEHPYELCVLGASGGGARVGETAARVAQDLRVPVLIVPATRPAIRRILICTAVGEPGKADIEFGGRIARRSGASVTILHVRPQDAAPDTPVPAAQAAHLEKGLMTLGRLTVTGQVKIRFGGVVPEIFA